MALTSPWRNDFPGLLALEQQEQTYLDSAATAQKPYVVLDALMAYYAQGAANVHRAQHLAGERVTHAFEAARERVARWCRATSSDEVIFTRGTTESINLLAYGLEHLFQPGDEILISAAEHHANLLPWQQLARRRNLELVVLPLTEQGDLDLDQAQARIGPRTRLLALTQLSNVLGRWQNLEHLVGHARNQGVLTVIDGAQAAAHRHPDVNQLGCDFYVCSAHKVFGPEGVGLLYGRRQALEKLQPWQFGGEMLFSTDYHDAQFRPAPFGFEAGTPNIAGVITFARILDYLDALPERAVREHESRLMQTLLDGLNARSGIHLLGQPHTALACFTVDDIHHADLAQLLTEQGIAVRTGHHCAMPLFRHLGHAGAVRVSLALYNNGDDLTRFFSALDKAMELLR